MLYDDTAKTQKIMFLLAAVMLAASLIYLNFNDLKSYWHNYLNLNSDTNISALIIDYGNGNQRMFEGPSTRDMNILMAILAAKNGDRFDIIYQANENKKPAGVFSIDSVKSNSEGKSWKVYLNGEEVYLEFDEFFVNPGDLILIKYE